MYIIYKISRHEIIKLLQILSLGLSKSPSQGHISFLENLFKKKKSFLEKHTLYKFKKQQVTMSIIVVRITNIDSACCALSTGKHSSFCLHSVLSSWVRRASDSVTACPEYIKSAGAEI